MKKYFMIGLIAALSPSVSFGYSARINELIAQKQAKMKELEKCQGTTKNLKIAGLSTLGITAVGVGANIAEAVLLNEYEGKVSKARKDKEDAQAAYDKAFKSNLEKRGDAAAQREREQAKYQHSCSHSESFDNLDGVIVAANAKTGVECKPANQEFNNTNCEITDFGVMTCSIDLTDGEGTHTHTYKHTFNTKNGDCSGIYTNEMASSQEDAQQKIAKAINKSNIKCDFDGNTATCYEVGNMFEKYTCKFGEIASSQPKNNILTYQDEKEFAKVHLSNNNTLVQLKRIVGVWSNKNDKKIDVNTCGDIEKHDTGQDFAKCSSPSDNIRYIFEFNALDSSTSVEPSLVEYVCEKWFNGEYTHIVSKGKKHCNIARDSVDNCVKYIMDGTGDESKCTPTEEEKTVANVSEIPVFKNNIRLYSNDNLGSATKLITWYGKQNNESFETSKCKVTYTGAPGVYGKDHVTCGEKRFVFKSLTAWADTAKKDLTEYFCKELSGGNVKSGKCSGNDEYVQQCVNYVMGKGDTCLTTLEMIIAIEKQQKDAATAVAEKAKQEDERKAAEKQIEENKKKEIQERKEIYCQMIDCPVNTCGVEDEKGGFWKVTCQGKTQDPVCYKKDDETYEDYDCESGLTIKEIKKMEKEKAEAEKQKELNEQKLEEDRKARFCTAVDCPNSTCKISELTDKRGYIQLTCRGDKTKNGCFKEDEVGSTTLLDCKTLKTKKFVEHVNGIWSLEKAREYIATKSNGETIDCDQVNNKMVCGYEEYNFDKLVDIEEDHFKDEIVGDISQAKQLVEEYTGGICTNITVVQKTKTAICSVSNSSPAPKEYRFKFDMVW